MTARDLTQLIRGVESRETLWAALRACDELAPKKAKDVREIAEMRAVLVEEIRIMEGRLF